MTKSRNNHYVPQWHQEGFFEFGKNTLAYLDLNPPQHTLSNGLIVTQRSKFNAPTSRAFCQQDLYSTFFGNSVNDEIERKLFGDIDTRGAHAIRAFLGADVTEWHNQFSTLFQYLDIQKIRTPKGLDWLRAQYPHLTQNELMLEMQGIRMMHCTIWAECVREIVSAEDANVKFLVSDHPVTIYNHAMPPNAMVSRYPNEPSIALKGSQTIFPLNRNFCLILTNLEYAEDHSAKPLEKRTFAGNYRQSVVRTDAFIRTRKLTSDDVIRINRVIKARAKRYIAAGNAEWLYPETSSIESWKDIRRVFLPPDKDLFRFWGEVYIGYEGDKFHYQDAFGRTEKEREFLKKQLPSKPLRARDGCGCGSGRAFGVCCQSRPIALRPTWKERSIRERNMMLLIGITKILGLVQERDWLTVRREITDEKIKEVYSLYDALWSLGTDLLAMLPKPDGRARAIYTGLLHPSTISNCAIGLSLYFDEILIEHPFVHPRTVNKKFSPLEHPQTYRQEFLKSVLLFLSIMPLVEQGLVTLFPSPCNFDFHLRDQMSKMAESRSKGIQVDPKEDAGYLELAREEQKRSMLLLPREALRRRLQRNSPELGALALDATLDCFEMLREQDPLAVLQDGSLEGGKDGGQVSNLKMVPNFEITMYLAQATGSCIVTDSMFRWRELLAAAGQGFQGPSPMPGLRSEFQQAKFVLPYQSLEIEKFGRDQKFGCYPDVFRKIFKYLSSLPAKSPKPNVEAGLMAEFKRGHPTALQAAKKSGVHLLEAKLSCLWPLGGIQDNTVNRLLLMSNSEHHLASVPMAFFLKRKIR